MSDEARELLRRLLAEGIGTAFLLMAIVGSGVMAQRVCVDPGVMLLAHALAVAGALAVLIPAFGAVSGAHFNPAVTLSFALRRGIHHRMACFYVVVQIVGAILGVVLSHLMFEMPAVEWGENARDGFGRFLGEVIATFGLVGFIWTGVRRAPERIPGMVACYVGAAIWFTSSAAFANPAVSIARAFTNSYAAIRPEDVLAFIAAQLLGAVAATFFFPWLVPESS